MLEQRVVRAWTLPHVSDTLLPVRTKLHLCNPYKPPLPSPQHTRGQEADRPNPKTLQKPGEAGGGISASIPKSSKPFKLPEEETLQKFKATRRPMG